MNSLEKQNGMVGRSVPLSRLLNGYSAACQGRLALPCLLSKLSLGLIVIAICLLTWSCNKTDSADSKPDSNLVGAARVDITPDYPVRLCGYGRRKTWNEGIEQKLWARALAIGDKNPVVVVTVDSIAVPSSIAEAAAKQLQEKFGITRERLVLAGTHSHTAPHPARDYLLTLFEVPLTEEEWKTVDRYSEQMLQGIVTAVSDAMKARTPCELSWTKGKVGFAMNRRKQPPFPRPPVRPHGCSRGLPPKANS